MQHMDRCVLEHRLSPVLSVLTQCRSRAWPYYLRCSHMTRPSVGTGTRTVHIEPSTGVTVTFNASHKFVSENCTPEITSAEPYSMYRMHLHAVALEAMDSFPEDIELFDSPAIQRMFRLCTQNCKLFEPDSDYCTADCFADLNALLKTLSRASNVLNLHALLHSM